VIGQAIRAALYGIADAVTLRRGIPRSINGERIRIPARWSRYYPRTYQPETHEFISRHSLPGTTAVDVGAHIGIFSVVMARSVGPNGTVLSFEPTPDTRRVLDRVVACNHLDGVVSVQSAAVAARPGRGSLHADPISVSNANSLMGRPGATETVPVTTVSLDSVLRETARVSCLKVDAEGAEIEVLQGAREAIMRWHPAIALDVHPRNLDAAGHDLEDLRALIATLGYDVPEASPLLVAEALPQGGGSFEVQLLAR
jgi:FkbM family methyltransferase